MTDAVDLLTLPFDQYQRYTFVAQVAGVVRSQLKKAQLRVLDVGGFFPYLRGAILPLAHFLPEDWVAAVDLETYPLPNYAVASGLALPFSAGAFDLVASCDTLEHVPPRDRPAFVDELLRIAEYCLVLVAPFDNEVTRRAERMVHEYITALGLHHKQLREHIDHGLPSADDLNTQLSSTGLLSIDFADGYLPHWLAMILVKLTPGLPSDLQLNLDRFYNRHFSPYDRLEPAYRRAFVVAKPGGEGLLPMITKVVSSRPASTFPDPSFASDMGRMLLPFGTVNLMEAFGKARSQSARARSRLAALEAENAHLCRLVAGYERGRFIRLMRWLHEQRRQLHRYFDGFR